MLRAQGPPRSEESLQVILAQLPEWHAQLSKLNEKMDDRQIELAEAALHYRIHNPTLKRNGSCETLRSNDDPGLGATEEDVVDNDTPIVNATTTTVNANGGVAPPRLLRNSTSPGPIRNSPNRRSAAAGISKRDSLPVLRKRKTESINSVAATPQNATVQRTRSMIIVYYEGSVQRAFSEMVNSISVARNGLRKAKLARQMQSYARAGSIGVLDRHRLRGQVINVGLLTNGNSGDHELGDLDADMTLEADDDLLPDLEADSSSPSHGNNGGALDADMTIEADDMLPDLEVDDTPTPNNGDLPLTLEADDNVQPDDALPPLQYRSTRLMNPNVAQALSRQVLANHMTSRLEPESAGYSGMNVSTRLGALGMKPNDEKDVFSDLDTWLEAASKICQDAAHEFLRCGSCRLEIERVEVWLNNIQERAEKGLEELARDGEQEKKREEKMLDRKWPKGFIMEAVELEADDGMGELEVDTTLSSSTHTSASDIHLTSSRTPLDLDNQCAAPR